MSGKLQKRFPVRDYDLAATLDCGQAFRWRRDGKNWSGVICGRWVSLVQRGKSIVATTAEPQSHWCWLEDYLQTRIQLDDVLATFPDDDAMRRAVEASCGLRLLRQEPWECLASFILSSTKQIVQIRQIVEALAVKFGDEVRVPDGCGRAFAFPSAKQIAAASESDLRTCKMGFRAPYLLGAARKVASGECDLQRIGTLSVDEARGELLKLHGVGEKIADCALLFGLGFPTAFPVDVWVMRALREIYFRNRKVSPARLKKFIPKHFGPNAGYAQQYLFHWIRMREAQRKSS